MSKILHHVSRKEFKKTHQKKLDEQKNLAAKKLEEEKKIKQLEEVAKPLKSDWRKEINLQESDWTPIAGSGPTNSTAQTFSYSSPNFETGEPITYTASGLGGVEASNTGGQVFVDLGFGDGEFTNAPTYSQLALAGYAKPMGFGVQRRQDQTENERIDAEIRKLQEQIKQLDQKISNLSHEQKVSEPEYTGMTYDQYYDRKKEINKKWTEKTQHLGQIMMRSNSASEVNAARDKYYEYNDARAEELDALDAEYKSQSDSHSKKVEDHYNAYSKKFDPLRKEQNALYAKIAELEKQRPINQQLDASQQAYPNLPFMGARVQPQPGDIGYVNPNVFGRFARSATDPIRYGGNMMFQGNPAGRAPGLSNFWSPDPAAAGTYSNPGRAKGIPGTRPNPTGTLTTAPRPRNVPRVTRGLTGTPQFKFPKGQIPPSNMFTQTADDAAVKAAQNAAQKSGGKTLSKFLGRAIPFANAALAGIDAGNRVRQGDYFGAALGGATAIPGPLGWTALGAQMGYDAIGRPFMGAPAITPTSGRGAGRSSFASSLAKQSSSAVGLNPQKRRKRGRRKGG